MAWVAAALAPAAAATATFANPWEFTADDAEALSAPDDGAGPVLSLGEILALRFSTPFATSQGESVSIFTLPPDVGNAQVTVRFGVWNNGAPVFVDTRNLVAGNSLTVGNLFQKGCSAFGGCDYIEIETRRTNGRATGVAVDYVDVNGEVVEVAAPTPEPSVWMLMILGFALIGLRMKRLRRGSRAPPHPHKGLSLARAGATS